MPILKKNAKYRSLAKYRRPTINYARQINYIRFNLWHYISLFSQMKFSYLFTTHVPLIVILTYKVEFVSHFQYDGQNNDSPIKSTNAIFMSLSRIPIIDFSIIH